MGIIQKSRTLFFTTSPRSPHKLIPEIELLMQECSGKKWRGNKALQIQFAKCLAEADTFQGETSKEYSDFSARDRVNRSPQGLGFVDLSPVVALTQAGEAFLYGERPSEIFLRQLIKFQIPSLYLTEAKKVKGTFWGHPYLEIIRLIRDLGYVTPDEFKIFALQLTDYRHYEAVIQKVLTFREEKAKRKGRYNAFVDAVFTREVRGIYRIEIENKEFSVRESLEKSEKNFIDTQKKNMRDYADACFRYLRFTDMFVSDGRSIRVAPEKAVEIDYLLETAPREPVFLDNKAAYKAHLFDVHLPALYSDDRTRLEEIVMRLGPYTRRDLQDNTIDDLKNLRDSIVQGTRDSLMHEQELQLKSYANYQEIEDTYRAIQSGELYDAPLYLEYNTWRAMAMLDGGEIKRNFKVDDGGHPTSTAPGNQPDIECEYDDFALSVEVTMQRGQRQYDSEGEPVTRHYAQFKQRTNKDTYCLFLAPTISKATLAHFFGLNQIQNIAAYGGKPKIIPLELDQFMLLLDRSYNHPAHPVPNDIRALLNAILGQLDAARDEHDWQNRIQSCVDHWLVAERELAPAGS